MSVLGLDSCCDAFTTLRTSRFATEGLKRDLRDEVEFRQARLTTQGKKLRASIEMYGRDAVACLRDGNEPLARQLVSQKVAMQNRLAHISTHWGVLESVRASLQPGARRCLEDVETCRLIMAKAQMSGDVAVRRPGEEDVDGVDDSDIDVQLARLKEQATKEPRAVLCGPPTAILAQGGPLHKLPPAGAGEPPAKPIADLLDLQASGSEHGDSVGDSAASSDDQLLCTGEGSAGSSSSRSGSSSGSPPGTPPPAELFPFRKSD